MRCKVCDSRQKEQVIKKCMHMFCSACVKANLDTRHRKCPACGVGFAASDVVKIYF